MGWLTHLGSQFDFRTYAASCTLWHGVLKMFRQTRPERPVDNTADGRYGCAAWRECRRTRRAARACTTAATGACNDDDRSWRTTTRLGCMREQSVERAVMPPADRLCRDDHAGDGVTRGEVPAGEDRDQVVEARAGITAARGCNRSTKEGTSVMASLHARWVSLFLPHASAGRLAIVHPSTISLRLLINAKCRAKSAYFGDVNHRPCAEPSADRPLLAGLTQ